MCSDKRLRQGFVLCAGKGTRLLPLTTFVPKCLVPVQGEPVLTKILRHLESYGIVDIICNVGNLIEHLVNYREQNSSKFLICYEEEPLGTAGSLFKNLDLLDEYFCVYYGDVLTNVNIDNLWKMHLKREADVSLYVHESLEPWTGGLVELGCEDSVISIHEKVCSKNTSNNLINSGILIFNKKSILKYVEKKPFDIAGNLLPMMLEDKCKVCALRISAEEYVQDMGTHDRLEKANSMLNIK